MAMVLECPPFSGYDSNSYQEKMYSMEIGGVESESNSNKNKADSRNLTGTDCRPTSALARGVQITEFAESRVNPTPCFLDEADILLEQYLSPGKLQLLTGADNLDTVVSLELKVDSRETSLGNFGSLLPNLLELKLSGSCISSVRDLGSSLRKLTVLWLTRCGLEELDGISSMLSLQELYLEYNEISDLSPLAMLEELETLDLEGNNIDDITQVQYLSLCPKLRCLALDGNPICAYPSPSGEEQPDYDYRNTIRQLLPDLLVLDDENLDSSSPIKHNVFDEDWAYLEELQKDVFLQEEFTEKEEIGAIGGERPSSAALRPATAYRPGSALRPSSGFRPLSASKQLSSMSGPNTPRPVSSAAHQRPVSSDAIEGIESASELTMGGVICGNPSKALRQRRSHDQNSKEDLRKGLNKLMQKGAILNNKADTEEEPLKPEDELNSIIEELQSWKLEHEKRMQVLRKSKEAQVLVVDHDGADLVDSTDEDDVGGFEHTPDSHSASTRHRHTADLRLKAMTSSADTKEVIHSGGDTHLKFKKKQSKFVHEDNYKSGRTQQNNHIGDVSCGDEVDSDGFYAGYNVAQSVGAVGDSSTELQEDHISFGNDEGHASPLRISSPTSAQIVNSFRSKQTESQSTRPRKLRVGPTGLPLSSQNQQPVIRNNIVSQGSRSNFVANSRQLSSKASVNILPSQPRIPRVLPELQGLVPHPPNNS
ncbi:unnamed protein product [Lymnaea stagnalis]|uniref:Leucine-rich repeat-containing protein 56 n=1 Tax=Lymnaea stagnalis TaxID=6523 RepID=A0AAV2H7D0_LYMST